MANDGFFQRLLRALGFAAEPPAPPPPAEPRPAPAPPRLNFDLNDERIPDSSRDLAMLIVNQVADLEERAAKRGLTTELKELDRIRSVHLPRLLQSYVDIPPEHRAEVFRETGRSASFQLNERLEKMTARLREISKMLARDNVNAFSTNIGFIDRQYGSQESPFD
ncbi:MAG TPA: hypothetical protein VD846_13560 [Allosphingosinicella sp.]|nr:hypothetical protein [Allosphingosinicella sp.]